MKASHKKTGRTTAPALAVVTTPPRPLYTLGECTAPCDLRGLLDLARQRIIEAGCILATDDAGRDNPAEVLFRALDAVDALGGELAQIVEHVAPTEVAS